MDIHMIHMIQVLSGNEITVARPGEDLDGLYVFIWSCLHVSVTKVIT